MNLFTIGYEGLDQESFISWLKHYGINVIADVRKLPLSRKKGFSKNVLKKTLAQNRIEYINYTQLGASKSLRNQLAKSGNYKTFFREYKKTLALNTDLIDEIRNMAAEGKIVALLCFEHDPRKCHRSIVADEIRKRDGNSLQLTHIDCFISE